MQRPPCVAEAVTPDMIGKVMKVDARNVACPKPVVMTIRALDTVEQGDTVEVLFTGVDSEESAW